MPNPDLAWRLTYGTPTREDLLGAAAIIGAYQQMIFDPEPKRRYVIRRLRFHSKEIGRDKDDD